MTLKQLKAVFRGGLVGNGGYSGETAAEAVAAGDATAISFGRPYMANPVLNAPLSYSSRAAALLTLLPLPLGPGVADPAQGAPQAAAAEGGLV